MKADLNILQLFNVYREKGGEEKSVRRAYDHINEIEGVSMERLWWKSDDWAGPSAPGLVTQVQKMFSNEAAAAELRAAVERRRPDALLAHNLYPVASPAIYRTARDFDLPVLQYIHNFRPFSVSGNLWDEGKNDERSLKGNFFPEILRGAWQGSRLKSAVLAAVIKNAHWQGWFDSITGWIAISEFMRGKFILAGVAPEKIVTLRHSWDARPAQNDEAEGDYYLFLSRLVPEKGVRLLLKAWAKLEEELGQHCPRLLIGGTGSEEEAVRAAAAQSPKIEYRGYVAGEEKESLIAGCRAMLAPSLWWEPLGLVTYEAYDFCRPMIAARSGGLAETVTPQVTGFLHEPNDLESLVQSVLACERLGPSGRRELGMNGRRWLLEEASPQRWKDQFQAILANYSR